MPLKKDEPDRLDPKTWVEEISELPFSGTGEGHRIQEDYISQRERLMELGFKHQLSLFRLGSLKTLIWLFGIAFFFTLLIIIALGFHIWGFTLPDAIVIGLSVATVGEIVGLIGTFLGIQQTKPE
jgi:cellulose synthase/poly-beta-1,6-N-acetylglucosamine synthase-like glycosyltransferase